jgi:nucleoside-diphosphate-sugar epimerase
MTKILVIGGAGYIGSVLVPALQERGYWVDVVDLCWFGNYLDLQTKLTKSDAFSCKESDLQGYEQIIFLAGISNDPMAEFSPSANFILNSALPSYLAFVSKKAGVRRFIYASSCSVYGYSVGKLYQEGDPFKSEYPYGVSKLQGERGCLQLEDDIFSVIALRKGTVCGHSPRMRMDLIVNTMFRDAVIKGEITVSNPALWRPILDIRDAVSAYLRAVQADYSISGTFNVASDNYTVGQVADMVKEELEAGGILPIRINIKNIPDLRNYKVSCEKAKIELGFKPQYSVKDIVADLLKHIRDYGDFTKKELYNIQVFKDVYKAYTIIA